MRLDFQAVIDRLKVALGVASNREVAERLGLTATNIGERKNRGALPLEAIRALCDELEVSYAWVISGAGSMRQDGRLGAVSPAAASQVLVAREPAPVHVGANAKSLLAAAMAAIECEIERRGTVLPADRRARLAWALYEMSLAAGRVNDAAVVPLVDLVLGEA